MQTFWLCSVLPEAVHRGCPVQSFRDFHAERQPAANFQYPDLAVIDAPNGLK
jgi:hypothetical protein